MSFDELVDALICSDTDIFTGKRFFASKLVYGSWNDLDELRSKVKEKLNEIFGVEKKPDEFQIGDIVRWKCWIFELKAIYLDSDGTKKYKTCWEECNKRWVPASELELIERRK